MAGIAFAPFFVPAAERFAFTAELSISVTCGSMILPWVVFSCRPISIQESDRICGAATIMSSNAFSVGRTARRSGSGFGPTAQMA